MAYQIGSKKSERLKKIVKNKKNAKQISKLGKWNLYKALSLIGFSQNAIADVFGVSNSAVSKALSEIDIVKYSRAEPKIYEWFKKKRIT